MSGEQEFSIQFLMYFSLVPPELNIKPLSFTETDNSVVLTEAKLSTWQGWK